MESPETSKASELEKAIHGCRKCGKLPERKYHPVYSFGDPAGKDILIVGLNPSIKEYENGHLSESPDFDVRRKRQLAYFEKEENIHSYFYKIEEAFFQDDVKRKLGWEKSFSEKVGFLDLVKCSTNPQWSGIKGKKKLEMRNNCEGYLKEQLKAYRPKIIIGYGADACRWLAKNFGTDYEEFENRKITMSDDVEMSLLFIPQTQGQYSKPEKIWIQCKILRMLADENNART